MSEKKCKSVCVSVDRDCCSVCVCVDDKSQRNPHFKVDVIHAFVL